MRLTIAGARFSERTINFANSVRRSTVVDAAALGQGHSVNERRVSGFRQSVAQLVKQRRFVRIAVFAVEVLVDQIDRLEIAATAQRHGPRLPEEGVHLPELVLLPLIERVIVALRALDLQAEKHLGRLGRGLHAVFVEAAGQKIHEPVEVLFARLADALGLDQLLHQPVVGHVALQGPAERLLQALAVHQRPWVGAAGAADENIGPQRGPIAGVLLDVLVAQQSGDEPLLAVVGRFVQVAFQLRDRGHAAQHVEVSAAAPLFVGGRGRGFEPVGLPMVADVPVDQRNLREGGFARRTSAGGEGQRGSAATVSKNATVAARAGPIVWQVECPANNANIPCVSAIGMSICRKPLQSAARGCSLADTLPAATDGWEFAGPTSCSDRFRSKLEFVKRGGIYCRKIRFRQALSGVLFCNTCIILLY